MAMTNAEKQAAFRARQLELDLYPLTIYAKREDHQKIKRYATKLKKK